MSRSKLKVPFTGRALLDSPYYNKGTAFTDAERDTFKLDGLLPRNVQTLDQQHHRAYEQYQQCPNNLAKNVFMTSMSEQNVVLFYKLLLSHLKEMFPVVYTPTEGEAIEKYSQEFRRSYGCFLDIEEQDDMAERLKAAAEGKKVRYLVVSDGEAILGLGDQGVGGILISVAKLILATACGGVSPYDTLPVVLDVGTNNESLQSSDLYLGLKASRTRGQRYDDFVETFVTKAHQVFPDAYIHFEDFGVTNARKILDRYRDEFACFNDDIQGTGCVVFAAINAALHITKTPLNQVRFLIYGAGSAGCGIARQIANGIAAEHQTDIQTAYQQITCVDKQGVLTDDMDLSIAQKPFARPHSEWTDTNTTDLKSIVSQVHPHVLIGTSTISGAFTEPVVKEMHAHVERPIILPLSNPTRLHEATPSDLIHWTHGAALIATGSPFDPVEFNGEVYEIGECNNSVCFPGIGLGCVLSKARKLTDEMLMTAIKGVASKAPVLNDERKPLMPDVEDAREVSVAIAVNVIREARRQGLVGEGDVPDSDDERELEEWVKAKMWVAEYPEYERVGDIRRAEI